MSVAQNFHTGNSVLFEIILKQFRIIHCWWNSVLTDYKVSGHEKLNHDVPDVANVKSKLDDKNLEYKPPTSTKRIETRKLVWRAESKIENNNLDYKKKALATSMENGIDKTSKVSVVVAGWSG